MSPLFRRWSLACLGVPGWLSGAELMVNGGFDAGLTGWNSNGAVSVTSGFALVEEMGLGSSSAVFQSVAVGPQPLILTFELFVAGMSSNVPAGLLADTAFGTLYFGDAAFGNDASAGTYDEQLALFDLDHNGLHLLAPGASDTSIPGRPNWRRVELEFTTTRQFVTFVVEDVDLNLIGADSVVAVDAVSLQQVPESSVVLLLVSSLMLLTRRVRGP